MSITSDLRGYADTAVTQGRQFVEQAVGQAQAQFTELTGSVGGFAKDNVNGLRTQAEKAVNLDALKAAVEPYLDQAKGYSAQVSERAEELFNRAKSDPRVARVLDTAESLTSVVLETVQEKVVKPLQELRGGKPAAKPAAPKAATKPATKPATRPATTKPAKAATKADGKPAAKATRKAPARKAPKA